MIYPHDYKSPLSQCEIRIDDQVYDVTHWRHKHPGGCELLDKFHNADATDAFYAFHSDSAVAQMKKFQGKPAKEKNIDRDELADRFEQFRQKLFKEGWMYRNWFADFFMVILPCTLMAVVGTWIALNPEIPYNELIAIFMIGLGMQQAGWMAHDYCHGHGTGCLIVGTLYGTIYNGFSPHWWNHKHNTHHCFPNRLEHDSDIHNDPFLHLWRPKKGRDVWYRQYQHYYYLIFYALLYVSWRIQSIQFVLGSKNWLERILIAVGYVWLAYLPWKVAIGSILVGGFCVAIVVTSNHQPEPILESDSHYNYCVDQFVTTRGIETPYWWMNYFCGGMQYQLEHHMFPCMPKYYYSGVRPLLKQFAAENDLPFKISSFTDITYRNFLTMKKWANAQ